MEQTPAPAIFTAPHDGLAEVPEPITRGDGVRFHGAIEYAKVPGYRPVELDLWVPAAAEPVPVVVYIHGGAFLFGSRRPSPVSEPTIEALLRRGIAVASIDYRFSLEAPFPACLHDAAAAVRWVRAFGGDLGLRTADIGAWGESAGGFLASFLGMNSSDDRLLGQAGVVGVDAGVKAVVDWFGPSDLALFGEGHGDGGPAPERTGPGGESEPDPMVLLMGGPFAEDAAAIAFGSPISYVNAHAAPMLIAHGSADGVIPSTHSTRLHDALIGAGASASLEIVAGADHGFRGVDPTAITEQSADFLAGLLSGEPS